MCSFQIRTAKKLTIFLAVYLLLVKGLNLIFKLTILNQFKLFILHLNF